MISKICNLIATVILVGVIVMAGGMAVLSALGYKPMGVLSGSMEPKYHVGSLVVVNTNVTVDAIVPGDVITFNYSDGTVVTHRVVSIDSENSTFQTKGDANDTVDFDPVPFSAFVGKAVFDIPVLGRILINLREPRGIAAVCVLGAILITLFVIPVFVKPDIKNNGGE
ncbi:MAG: signal peptidase I [Defluviitaleaceae bacterium]|nr:signal peptidase I [Defluviitaleaceae bacterium]